VTTAEKIEMLDIQIEAIYRTFYETFGPVRVPLSEELAYLWNQMDELEASA
jgi:hypothetical protein